MNGRIDIAKVPFIRWNLAVRFHVPLPSEKVKLLFSEAWVNHRKGDAVKSRIPRGKKRVFPPGRPSIVSLHKA